MFGLFDPKPMFHSPWQAVLVQALVSIALLEVARTICSYLFRPRIQRFVNETLCTMLLCVLAFEKGVVRQKYGDAVWLFAIFCAVIMFSYIFRGAMANPIVAVSAFIDRRISFTDLLLYVACQSLGAILAYRYIKLTWSMGLCPYRSAAVSHLADCRAFMQVSPVNSFLVEAALAALCVLAGHFGPQDFGGRFFMAAFIPTLIYFGSGYSGAIFNPALAIALQYGCRGLSLPTFFFVYWLGPAVGAIVATLLINGLRGGRPYFAGPKLRLD